MIARAMRTERTVRSASGGDDRKLKLIAGGRRPQIKLTCPLRAPYPSEDMICWPVSAHVGNVKNNDPSLIELIAGVL